jgi:hypothetical protein
MKRSATLPEKHVLIFLASCVIYLLEIKENFVTSAELHACMFARMCVNLKWRVCNMNIR